MSKKVSLARMYETFHAGAFGQIPDTLPSASKTLPGLELWLEDNGMLRIKTTKFEVLIGAASVKGVILDPSEFKKDEQV